MDPTQRQRIATAIDRLIRLLDALDAPGMDLEPDQDGMCEAGDDNPHLSGGMQGGGMSTIGDDADAEWSGDECEPSDANEFMGERLNTVMGGVPA